MDNKITNTNSGKFDKNSKAWFELLNENPEILEEVKTNGKAAITADKIRKYREPRLMAKFDSSDKRPKPFQDYDINIIPSSTKEYILGPFKLFQTFPDIDDLPIKSVTLPSFDTLSFKNITSEATAINALTASGILESFLGTTPLSPTFNGRTRSGNFTFDVDCFHSSPQSLDVQGAQIEVDGGFENAECVVILEAKNFLSPDFNVRQLYFPFRKYSALTDKPIRLVFCQYSNGIFNLFEYSFSNPGSYSSITAVQQARYTIEPIDITMDEIRSIYENCESHSAPAVPFPQANSLDRLISYLELLGNNGGHLSQAEFKEEAGVVSRQVDYYLNAGRYLGLVSLRSKDGVGLTPSGKGFYHAPPRERFIKLVTLIFGREIFRKVFSAYFLHGALPSKDEVALELQRANLQISGSTTPRRAETVLAWAQWILHLPEREGHSK